MDSRGILLRQSYGRINRTPSQLTLSSKGSSTCRSAKPSQTRLLPRLTRWIGRPACRQTGIRIPQAPTAPLAPSALYSSCRSRRRRSHYFWWTVPDSNWRPLLCHRSALPTELTAQKYGTMEVRYRCATGPRVDHGRIEPPQLQCECSTLPLC